MFLSAFYLVGLYVLFLAVFCVPLQAQSLDYFRIQEVRARPLFKKGLYLFNSQHYVASRKFFYDAIRISPFFHLAHLYLGDAYYYSGEWERAAENWDTILGAKNTSSGFAANSRAYFLAQERVRALNQRIGYVDEKSSYTLFHEYKHKAKVATGDRYAFQGASDIAFSKSDQTLYFLSLDARNLSVISQANNRIVRKITGPLFDKLQAPMGLSLSEDSRLYITDYKTDQVRVFAKDGRNLFNFGATGSKPGEFFGPTRILAHGARVFVSDSGNQRVQIFDLLGNYIQEFGPKQLGAEAPKYPTGLAVGGSEAGREILYVADADDGSILSFDLRQGGRFLGRLGSKYLKSPQGLDYADGNLLVSDEKKGVFFYNRSHNTWKKLPPIGQQGTQVAPLLRPSSVKMDLRSNLYISDYATSRFLLLVPLQTRINNLSNRVQKIEATSFPQVAVLLSVRDRLNKPFTSTDKHNFAIYENDNKVFKFKSNNMDLYNKQNFHVSFVKESTTVYTAKLNESLKHNIEPMLSSLRPKDSVAIIRVKKDARLIYHSYAQHSPAELSLNQASPATNSLKRDVLSKATILRLLSAESKAQQPGLSKGLYQAISIASKKLGPRSVFLLVSGKYFPKAFDQYSLKQIEQYAQAQAIPIDVFSYELDANPRNKAKMRDIYKRIAKNTGGRYFRSKLLENTDLPQIAGIQKEADTSPVYRPYVLSEDGGFIVVDFYELLRQRKDKRYLLSYESHLSKSAFQGHYVGLRVHFKYLGTEGIGNSGFFVP